jgi:hypothetical protein
MGSFNEEDSCAWNGASSHCTQKPSIGRGSGPVVRQNTERWKICLSLFNNWGTFDTQDVWGI